MQPLRTQLPEIAQEEAIKAWLDALANGRCDAPAFLQAMQGKYGADPDENWEVLSQLDQYYRRGRIETDVFKSIKTALAESAMGLSSGSIGMDKSAVRAAPAPPSTPPSSDTSPAVPQPPRHASVAPDAPAVGNAATARDVPVARDAAPSVPRDIPVARDHPRARDPVIADVRVPRNVPPARDPVITDPAVLCDVPPVQDPVIAVPVVRDVPMPRETQSSSSVPDLKPGALLRRRYRIEAVLGQGRMGTVYQVLDEFRLEGLGTQRLALKVLHPAVANRADLLAELRREFQSLQLLSHPNILRVFEFDRDGPLQFFTMELLTGTSLSRLLQARKLVPLERPQALAVIRDIGAALVYAHARGAVHGDLDLQHIFITGSGELRVMGFGGSFKAREAYQASNREITPPLSASTCASCQVLEGERADIRDDVFSLAYIAYLLLSGAHPFTTSTAIEARAARYRIRRPANLSGRQWQALRCALRWESEKRPIDVEQWLKELEIRGAAKRLAPLNELLQTPSNKKSPWLAAGIAAGVAALILAGYWALSHPGWLPSLDSSANRAPAVARPSAAPPPAPAISAPASQETPLAPATKLSTPSAISAPAAHEAPVPVTSKPQPPAASRVPAPAALAASAAPTASAAPRPSASSAAAAPAIGASKVELAEDTIDVPAGQASAEILVRRKGDLRGETSFTWWTESGTAKPGVDFAAVVPRLAYFTTGKSTVAVSVSLRNARRTQPKSFYVVIDQSPGGVPTGARTLTLVTLLP